MPSVFCSAQQKKGHFVQLSPSSSTKLIIHHRQFEFIDGFSQQAFLTLCKQFLQKMVFLYHLLVA